MRPDPLRRAGAASRPLVLALLLALLPGCFNPFSPRIAPTRGTSSPPPVPNSASQVVELFAWCWNNRAYQEYTEIFTEDFRFQYTTPDSAGQPGRGEFLTREQELETALHLFVEGSATEPPARSITLEIGRPLLEYPDSRHGVNGVIKTYPWHKEITTQVTLRIDTGEQEFQVVGNALFYLVRGDSAAIPPSLQARFGGDSTRWWIERWEDDTDNGPGAAASLESSARRVRARFAAGAVSRPTAGPASATATGEPMPLSWARLKLGYLAPPAGPLP